MRKENTGNSAITCPVSAERVNENAVRIVALLVIVITLTGVWFKLPILIGCLAADFLLRTFTNGNYSLLKYIARKVTNYLGLAKKMTDAAPKKFAAGIGLLFCVIITGLQIFNYDVAAQILAGVLLVCAGLESFLGFCLGCVVYTYLVLPFLSTDEPEQSPVSVKALSR